MADVKRCAGCYRTQPVTEFGREKPRRDGLQPKCKTCRREHREGVVQRPRAYRGRPIPPLIREMYRETSREYNATGAHGLTRAERDFIEAIQLHRCAVCLDPLGGDSQINHDHACCRGEKSCGNCLRGVVHKRCNVLVATYEHGHLRNPDRYVHGRLVDPELVKLAAFFVEMTPVRMAPFFAGRAAVDAEGAAA